MVRRDGTGLRLLTRNGRDWSARFPLILEAAHELKVRSCLIDGEAVCCEKGLAVFERLRRKHHARAAFHYAFDLLELDGVDLRREPIETRKEALASVLRGVKAGLRLNEHFIHSGEVVYRHACKMGLEGIVSKRLGSRYGPHARLAQVQEPGGAGGEARGRGGLGAGRALMPPGNPAPANILNRQVGGWPRIELCRHT